MVNFIATVIVLLRYFKVRSTAGFGYTAMNCQQQDSDNTVAVAASFIAQTSGAAATGIYFADTSFLSFDC